MNINVSDLAALQLIYRPQTTNIQELTLNVNSLIALIY